MFDMYSMLLYLFQYRYHKNIGISLISVLVSGFGEIKKNWYWLNIVIHIGEIGRIEIIGIGICLPVSLESVSVYKHFHFLLPDGVTMEFSKHMENNQLR